MNFIQVKLFIVIHLFCVIDGTSYYCKIEDRLCDNNRSHVACHHDHHHHHHHHENQSSKEINNSSDNKYELLQQWNEIILSILDNFNSARNHVAQLQNTANMRLLLWHDEYQYLAEYSIKYPSHHNADCYATEQFPITQLYTFNGSVNSTDDIDLLNDIIKDIRRHTKLKNSIGPDTSSIYTDASIYNVGCGLGKLYDETSNTVAYLLRCIHNSDNNKTIQTAIEGTPCSRCHDYSIRCNIIYPALCGSTKFPTSAINPFSYQNQEGNVNKLFDLNDSTKVDMILWFLGIILFLGLFVSCSIKLRKIFLRNNSEMGVVVSEKLYRDRA